MKIIKSLLLSVLFCTGMASTAIAASANNSSTPGVQGYDLVSYHASKRPVRGNGHFVAVHDGVTYVFANEENKAEFDRHPDNYVPAYGGYCAFGASVGEKFVGDPEVWRIADGKLYLNLDTAIQDEWFKDVPGRIKTADQNWKKIKDIPAADL